MVPRVIFKPMGLEDNIDTILWQYKEFPDITKKMFPNIDENHLQESIIDEVTVAYNKNKKMIDLKVSEYQEIWDKYNDLFLNELANYLNISWDNNITITALIGVVPIFPRYLNTYTFSLSYEMNVSKFLRISAHEICHFLWFKKWHELSPDTPEEEYESPHLPWQYSEMVVDPILNSKSIQEIFDNQFFSNAYDRFYEIENGKMMDDLINIYQKDMPVENKIKDGFELIKKYKDKL